MKSCAAALACAFVVFGACLRFRDAGQLVTRADFNEHSRQDYYEYGRSLQEFGVLGWDGAPDAFRGVAYPAFLSWMETYDPAVRSRVPAAHALLSSAVVPVAAAAAFGIGGLPAGAAAAALAAFDPELRTSIGGCQVEIVFSLLIALVALALVVWSAGPTIANTLTLGLAIGTSLLCRSVLCLFPLVLVAAYWRKAEFVPTRRRWAWILLASSYGLLSPWIVRNFVQFKRVIPFEDQAATRNLLAGALGIVDNNDAGNTQDYQDRLAARIDPRGAAGPDRLAWLRRLAVERILSRPGEYLRSCAKRLFYVLWNHAVVFIVSLAVVFWRRRERGVQALALLCGYFVLVHVPMSVELRYFQPIVPCLLVLAAAAVPASAAEIPERPAVAAVLALTIPLCLLSFSRLAEEVALSKMPCALPASGIALYRCGQRQDAAGHSAAAQASWDHALARLDRDRSYRPRLRARIIAESEATRGVDRPERPALLAQAAAEAPEELRQEALRLQDSHPAGALRLFDALARAYPASAV
ncbi:MAG TPA: hypothetical protein VN915_12410, partial [Elusimicrobiota bacterium]|nr:hypothetical protein [Elusimicrobiota bacterium]